MIGLRSEPYGDPYRNGSLQVKKTLAQIIAEIKERTTPGTRMEMDQVLSILMALQTDGARRDERLTTIQKQLDGLLSFREERMKLSQAEHRAIETSVEAIRDDIATLNRRVQSLEDRGLTAWTMKRIAQAAAIIGALSTVGGAVFAVVFWLAKRVIGF